MEYITIECIQEELKRHYEVSGKLQTFVDVINRLQKDPSNLSNMVYNPFPANGNGLSDEQFYELFKRAQIPLDSFRESQLQKNWRDHPLFSNNRAFINIQKHINFADQQYHTHSYYEITYVMSGNCTMIFDRKTLELAAGDMCIIIPNSSHGIHITDDGTFAVNIIISSYTFRSMMTQIVPEDDPISYYIREILYHEDNPNFLFLKSSNPEEMKTYIKEATCHSHQQQEDYSYGMTFSWISLMLCAAFRDFRSSISLYRNNNPAIQDNYLEILEYLNQEYKTATLEILAQKFGYNPTYVSRLIRRITGQSFTELITGFKLRDACSYLEHTDMPVREIAQLCGFEDQNYFGRVFRKHYHLSPSDYRAQM